MFYFGGILGTLQARVPKFLGQGSLFSGFTGFCQEKGGPDKGIRSALSRPHAPALIDCRCEELQAAAFPLSLEQLLPPFSAGF